MDERYTALDAALTAFIPKLTGEIEVTIDNEIP